MGTRIPLCTFDIEAQNLKEKLEMSTAEIGLTVRTTNCLEDHDILTVKKLLERKPADLLAISNFGEKTLEEVYKALEEIGLYRTGGAGGCRQDAPIGQGLSLDNGRSARGAKAAAE